MSKSVTVETDDSNLPRATLTLSANVVVDLGFERDFLALSGVRRGEAKTEKVRVLAKEPEKLKFGPVKTDVEGLTTKLVSEPGPDGKPGWTLDVNYKPTKIGDFSGTVSVETTAPTPKTLTLNVRAKVEGDIRLEPTRLTVVKGDETGAVGVVQVRSDRERFKIKEAKDPQGFVTAKIKTDAAGQRYTLEVTLTDEGKKHEPTVNTTVTIVTDSKDQPELKLPVYFRRPSAKSPGQGGARPAGLPKKLKAR